MREYICDERMRDDEGNIRKMLIFPRAFSIFSFTPRECARLYENYYIHDLDVNYVNLMIEIIMLILLIN